MSKQSRTVGPGTVLAGRYEVTEEIGRGGFGRVYKARQLNMDRDVAVKVLPSQFMAIEDVVERFKREAKLASRLSHPNTITLHDYGQHEDSLFIVMELLQGEDLADVLRREGRLPVDRIINIARQVLKSLAEAHTHSIVHRDLKPENIFLSVVAGERDVVKVVDFGIAKLALPDLETPGGDARKLTLSGSTVGTPTYMSPEQAAGEQVDGSTDLYALGVMMYEMAVGRAPFADKDAVKVMRAHLFEPVPPIRDPQIQNSLIERVIMKALEKERERRFQSAHEFLLALAGEPVAKPKVQGFDLNSLSGGSLVEESRPSTDRHEAEDRQATLQYAPSQSKAEPGDAIPFGVVGESKEREKATVRSGINEVSGLSSADSSLIDAAPPGFSDTTTGSSILTVIEPGNEDDVILLTTPKSDESDDEVVVLEAQSEPEVRDIDLQVPNTPDGMSLRESGELVAAPATADEWSWGESAPHTGNHLAQSREHSAVYPTPKRSMSGPIILLLLIFGGLGAAGWFFWPQLSAALGITF